MEIKYKKYRLWSCPAFFQIWKRSDRLWLAVIEIQFSLEKGSNCGIIVKSYGDWDIGTYADLTIWKPAVTWAAGALS